MGFALLVDVGAGQRVAARHIYIYQACTLTSTPCTLSGWYACVRFSCYVDRRNWCHCSLWEYVTP